MSSLKLVAWSLTLRRFCPPDERHVPWSRVRVENYPYHLTHTLVKRLTPDLIGRDLFNAENPIRSGLKFYNLHQTLNTSINALNSFTDICCISSARSGFVFFISFTSFFLILICPYHTLSGTSCQACCLELVARAFQVRGNAQKPRVHFNGLYSELTRSS